MGPSFIEFLHERQMLTPADKEKQYIAKMIESYISVSSHFYP